MNRLQQIREAREKALVRKLEHQRRQARKNPCPPRTVTVLAQRAN